jgi:YVTN family beta-propeller protein
VWSSQSVRADFPFLQSAPVTRSRLILRSSSRPRSGAPLTVAISLGVVACLAILGALGSGGPASDRSGPGRTTVSLLRFSPRTVANIAVGAYPTGAAYDGDTGEIAIAGPGSRQVSVVCDGSASCGVGHKNTVVGWFTTPSAPYAVVYDGGKGEYFTTGGIGSDTASVFNATTGHVVTTVAVGSYPAAALYDPVTGEVFVANFDSSNVTLISDTSDKPVANISVGEGPFHMTYDSRLREVFVPNELSNNVSVISDVTNKIVATIAFPIGSEPGGAAYDCAKSEIFVSDLHAHNVSIVSDATNGITATIAVGNTPTTLLYDSAQAEVVAANWGSANLSVISDSTNTVVASVAAGTNPASIAYDPAWAEIFVPNYGSSNVTVIALGTVPGASSSPSGGTFLGLNARDGFAVGAIVGVVVGFGAGIGGGLALRRRHRAGSEGTARNPPPPPSGSAP